MSGFVFGVFSLFLGGCETTAPKNYRSHPEMGARLQAGRDVVAAPSGIAIKELGAGGVPEEIDEYSDEANRIFAIKIEEQSANTPGEFWNGKGWKTLQPSEENKEELAEAMALADAVMSDIIRYSYYGMYPGFEHKRKDFRYSVGDISNLLGSEGGDALLIVKGVDYYTTAGRKTVNAMKTVLLAAATGSGYIATEGAGVVYAMLVDRDGEVLWVTQYGGVTMDLRQEAEIDAAAKVILHELKKALSESKT